jgi:hypothetical protein
VSNDPFDDPGGGLQRDRWDRPLILRPWEKDGPCPDAEGRRWRCYVTRAHRHYTRASTFAAALDDGPGLGIWMKRHVGLAFSWDPNADIRAVVAGMDYDDGKLLDERIEEALTRHASRPKTDSLRRSNWGTAIHRFTEPDSPPDAPAELVTDVESFRAALDVLRCITCDNEPVGADIIDTEVFVVNDGWLSAGTFDHRVRCRGCDRVRVLDKKTGSSIHPISMAIQLRTYVDGARYDEDSGERIPIETADDVAYIAHIPFGSGTCTMHEFDMRRAEELCDVAYDVRRRRAGEYMLYRTLD